MNVKQAIRTIFHIHHQPLRPLKYPSNPLCRPDEAPRPVNEEYGVSNSYTLFDLLLSRARILGGALITAMPNNNPVTNPPICEKLSRPGNNPNAKQMIT